MSRPPPPVRLWSLTPTEVRARLGDPGACLDADERERWARHRHPEDRESYATAHALLRHTLSEREPSVAPADWRFTTGEHGRPELVPPSPDAPRPPDFNLSHARGRIACIVAYGAPCGVDVERVRALRRPRELADRILAPGERIGPGGPTREEELDLLLHWSLKEALLKGVGTGLALGPHRVALRIGVDGRAEITEGTAPEVEAQLTPVAGMRWHLRWWLLGEPRMVLAAAVRSAPGAAEPHLEIDVGDAPLA